MTEIRLGTIGSGEIVRNILDGVSRTENIRLEAVYSRSEEKGRALAEGYGANKVYTDIEAFLSDEAVNFVYVASPNILHYEYSKRALLAGKNVLCEKPFCPNARQAEELMQLAGEKGLYLIETVPTTYLPNYPLLRAALSKIGRVRLVLGNYSQYSSRYDKLLAGERTNVFDPAFAGGSLMDINFYNVYLTLALFGMPAKAQYFPNLNGGIDTSGIVQLEYEDFQASLAGAKDSRGVNYYQIEGEKGFVYVSDGSNGLVSIRTVCPQGEFEENLQPDPSRWYYEVQSLARLISSGDTAAFEERRKLTLAVCALVEEMRKKAGIRFPGDEE